MKARLSNNFLKVTNVDKTLLCWFPIWWSISPEFLNELANKNQSLVFVEDVKNGTSKSFRVTDNKLADIWLNNKTNKDCRKVLIECATKF